jgi:hypothetical protein
MGKRVAPAADAKVADPVRVADADAARAPDKLKRQRKKKSKKPPEPTRVPFIEGLDDAEAVLCARAFQVVKRLQLKTEMDTRVCCTSEYRYKKHGWRDNGTSCKFDVGVGDGLHTAVECKLAPSGDIAIKTK